MTIRKVRPATLDDTALGKLKRPDLIALYESWLTFDGSKLDPAFASNRKNTKAVIIRLIMDRQPVTIGEVNKADETSIAADKVSEATGNKVDTAIADLARRKVEPGAPFIVPKGARPKTRLEVLMDRMHDLYRNRPDFLPAHLRPVGFVR